MNRMIGLMMLMTALPAWTAEVAGDYLGQKPPGAVPQVFAPGIISVDGPRERTLTLSPGGDELFFTRTMGWPNSRIMHMKREGNRWSGPEYAAFLKDAGATQPAFSPDGEFLYYSTSYGKSDTRHFRICRSRKIEGEWSEPEDVIDMGGGMMMEYHPSVARDGSMYFLYWDFHKQTGDLYVAKRVDGKYAEPELLEPPISTKHNEVRPTIDPDGKCLLFLSDRPGGLGGTDVYVAFKNADDTWSAPENLGSDFNTPDNDQEPTLSPDGNYWFFLKNNDIYWRTAPVLSAPR